MSLSSATQLWHRKANISKPTRSGPWVPTIGIPGVLTWDTFPGLQQTMLLDSQGASSNLAFGIFGGSRAGNTLVAFENQGLMNLQDDLDPRNKAGNGNLRTTGAERAYYRWYLCVNKWWHYQLTHLMWKYGGDGPWDESCEPVDVKRVFVPKPFVPTRPNWRCGEVLVLRGCSWNSNRVVLECNVESTHERSCLSPCTRYLWIIHWNLNLDPRRMGKISASLAKVNGDHHF